MHFHSLYDKLSKVAMSFPGVHEKPCHDTPAFYTEKKLFVRLKEDGETIALYNKERDDWIAKNEDIFFITDHYKNYPMLLVDLNMVSKEDLVKLIEISWRIRASKKALKQYDAKNNK
jgi:hypothetical protein